MTSRRTDGGKNHIPIKNILHGIFDGLHIYKKKLKHKGVILNINPEKKKRRQTDPIGNVTGLPEQFI